jgi:hypothetical protein
VSNRLQVREPLGPLVSAREAPLAELEHYPGGRWGPYLSTGLGVTLGVFSPDLLAAAGMQMPPFMVLVPFLVALWLPPYVIPWSRRLRMRRLSAWDGSGEAPEGAARVAGVVRVVDDPFTVPGARRPLVYARTRYPMAGSDGWRTTRGREDVRGVRFQIVLSTGAAVHLEPAEVRLLEGDELVPEVGTSVRWALGAPWAREARAPLHRSSLAPGDRVEAVGELVRRVDVEGQAAPGRGVPMVHLIRPAWPGGVWIRRVG